MGVQLCILNDGGDRVPLIDHYAGTLRADDARLSSAPLNTDSLPIIEYLAPINHRFEKAGRKEWFIGQQMFEFVGPYFGEDALLVDPYLASIDPA